MGSQRIAGGDRSTTDRAGRDGGRRISGARRVSDAHRAGLADPAGAAMATVLQLQRAAGNQAVTSLLQGDPDQLAGSIPRSGGRALAPAVLRSFENAFGADLSTVRVHTGGAAERSAAAWSATAYTAGEHVVFGRGSYAPGTSQGNHLLAHELAHVVQQRVGGVRGRPVPGTSVEVSEPGDASERAADEVARRVTARLGKGSADEDASR